MSSGDISENVFGRPLGEKKKTVKITKQNKFNIYSPIMLGTNCKYNINGLYVKSSQFFRPLRTFYT